MPIPIIMDIQLVIIFALGIAGLYQYFTSKKAVEDESIVLSYAVNTAEEEQRRKEMQLQLEYEEAEKQKERVFGMDVLIRHGSAFGGFSAILNDGRKRKGSVSLDQIMMFGKHPSGNEFTYYIEEQGLEILATESPLELMIRSKEAPFEIRDAGVGRDQGVLTGFATIRKDVLYYIVLESKHEISIKATKSC